jgi:acetoin utilization protein AcuB
MTLDPVSVPSDAAMTEVADVLVKHKVGGLPVVDGGRLEGIITQLDVLRFLCASAGSARGGSQFGIRLDGSEDALADILCDLRAKGLVFTSVFTAVDPTRCGSRNAYVTIADLADKSVEDVVELLQSKYTLLFYVAEGVTVDLV